MLDVDDVDACFVDFCGDRRERARLVVSGDAETRDPALPHQVADQNVGEQVRIDIAAAKDASRPSCRKAILVGNHRREAGSAGAFDNRLFNADKHRDRALQLALGHEHHIIRQVAEDPRRELAWLLDRNAFRKRVAPKRHLTVLDGAFHRGIELSLDTDQLDVRLYRAGGDRDARHKAAAPNRNDDRVEIRRVLEHFNAESARTSDDLRIIESVDKHVPILERKLPRLGKSVVVRSRRRERRLRRGPRFA